MSAKSEFAVANAYTYDRSSPLYWIISHIWRYKRLFIMTLILFAISWASYGYVRILIGEAAEYLINPDLRGALLTAALAVLAVLLLDSGCALVANLSLETIAQRLSRDAREELYIDLLGKSQTFHDRQRVGDIMARATEDVNQLNVMVNPGILFTMEIILGLVIPITYIASINVELLLVPLVFVVVYGITVRLYWSQLSPVIRNQRRAYGQMNAGLEESISGIEIVKASAQEPYEREKFYTTARRYRDYFAQQGRVEARYLPMLFYAFAVSLTFLHTMALYDQSRIDIAGIIGVMGLVGAMRFPIFISIASMSLIQLGLAGADRILTIINDESDLDENSAGYSQPVKGAITFENVSFGYENGTVIEDISFEIAAGATVAVVGQTGSGKSTLTDLINRTYDVTAGRILVDGVDVREWNLTSLRSQISRIEQDVFLFSRTLSENIAFGAPGTPQTAIEAAAKDAQAHDFIMDFQEGYETNIGGRGVTLSGGQRQRIALARAFLSNPRIMILDDSTSAIDSATEDEIQKAIHKAQQGRTTLMITHRLSQIRWADHILVLDQGRLIASGTHDDLLRTSAEYRRIFARYDSALPPLETGLSAD